MYSVRSKQKLYQQTKIYVVKHLVIKFQTTILIPKETISCVLLKIDTSLLFRIET